VSRPGEESLAETFWGVSRRLRQITKQALEPWDITPSQSRALSVLLRAGTMRLSELSDHLRIAPRSTTEVVDGLEGRDLVRRQPDPGDRRATLVALTDRGAELGKAIQAARDANAERFFDTLSEADRADLTRILQLLRQ
jgi:DNA-binding MarR family transcriptional regulator